MVTRAKVHRFACSSSLPVYIVSIFLANTIILLHPSVIHKLSAQKNEHKLNVCMVFVYDKYMFKYQYNYLILFTLVFFFKCMFVFNCTTYPMTNCLWHVAHRLSSTDCLDNYATWTYFQMLLHSIGSKGQLHAKKKI